MPTVTRPVGVSRKIVVTGRLSIPPVPIPGILVVSKNTVAQPTVS